MPFSAITRASPWIMSGELTLACFGKFMEPSVRLAMSGFRSPVRLSTSERHGSVLWTRPDVVTQITMFGSEIALRIPLMISM